MKLRHIILIAITIVTIGCSQAPTEPTVIQQANVDSLLGVIDTLRISLGRKSCIVDCFRATLDSLEFFYNCECGR